MSLIVAVANLRSDLFKTEAWTQASADQSLRGVQYPTLHKSVGTYLGQLAAEEIRSSARPEFKKWAGRGTEFKAKWKEEMLLYSQNQFPYNMPIDESRPLAVMKWFEGLIDDPDGQLLPVRR